MTPFLLCFWRLQAALTGAPELDGEGVAQVLQHFQDSTGADLAAPLAPFMGIIDRSFGGVQSVTMEGIVAALENEASAAGGATAEEKAWAAETLTLLQKHSPTSLKITHRLLTMHADPSVTVASALSTEYTVAQRCMRTGGLEHEAGARVSALLRPAHGQRSLKNRQ